MPQGFYLGPLIFLVLINDLTAGCLLHKFVDDTTLSEIIPKGETNSNMSSLVEDILHWSQCNLMNINWSKTKELVLGSDLAKNFCRELCVDHNIVERVSVFFTARCTLVQSAVLRSHVVCLSVSPSVCLSVTLVDCDHIGWNSFLRK